MAPLLPEVRHLTIPPFLKSLYTIVELEDPQIVGWREDGVHFEIRDLEALSKYVLPKYFRHQKFSSLQRQLNNFCFQKLTKSRARTCTYYHPNFNRGQASNLLFVKRKGQDEIDSGNTDFKEDQERKSSSANSMGYTSISEMDYLQDSSISSTPVSSSSDSDKDVSNESWQKVSDNNPKYMIKNSGKVKSPKKSRPMKKLKDSKYIKLKTPMEKNYCQIDPLQTDVRENALLNEIAMTLFSLSEAH